MLCNDYKTSKVLLNSTQSKDEKEWAREHHIWRLFCCSELKSKVVLHLAYSIRSQFSPKSSLWSWQLPCWGLKICLPSWSFPHIWSCCHKKCLFMAAGQCTEKSQFSRISNGDTPLGDCHKNVCPKTVSSTFCGGSFLCCRSTRPFLLLFRVWKRPQCFNFTFFFCFKTKSVVSNWPRPIKVSRLFFICCGYWKNLRWQSRFGRLPADFATLQIEDKTNAFGQFPVWHLSTT